MVDGGVGAVLSGPVVGDLGCSRTLRRILDQDTRAGISSAVPGLTTATY